MDDQLTFISSAELGDSPLPQKQLDGEQLSSAKRTNTAERYLGDTGQMSPLSETSGTLTPANTGELHCSQEDSPANPFLMQTANGERGPMMTASSGQKCGGLLRGSDRISSWQRMLLESSTWHSTKCFLSWRPMGTPQGRLYFQLVPSTPPTDGIESGFWPTPTSRDHKDCGDSIQLGNVKTNSLLGRAVRPSKKDGSLSPLFVEWLMGYPERFTELPHLATPSSPRSLGKS